MRRVLCLWLPRWAIDRRPQRTSGRPGEAAPFALVAAAAGRRLLAAVDPAAEAAGLAPGMPLADALSFVPGLATAAATPAEDAAALRRLAEWCTRYTPWAAPDGGDGVRLDITGCAHLWGGEAALAGDLAARLARRGVTARIAIADTLGAAWAAARFLAGAAGPAILDPGAAQQALAPLPVEGLRLDPATAQGLRRVGLKQIGDLYPMPRDALARRFGRTLVERLDQALDRLPEPLSPLGETPSRRVRLTFAEPIRDPADLARAIERLTADLVPRLAREGVGARRLGLGFYRVDGRVEQIRIGTARPSRDPRHLTALLVERLGTVDPGLGVEDVILAAFVVEKLPPEQIALPPFPLAPLSHDPPFSRSGGFAQKARHSGARPPAANPESGNTGALPYGFRDDEFSGKAPSGREGRGEGGARGPSAPLTPPSPSVGGQGRASDGGSRPDRDALAPLFDRLGNRLGRDAVYRLELRGSHVPERAVLRAPVDDGDRPAPPAPAGARKPPRPVRLLDPPQPIEASWLLPDDPPFRFTWRRRAHRVVRADGPERIAAEWWRPKASAALAAVRDYYRVEDDEGRRLWLFRAGLPGGAEPLRWFVHGIFA